MGYNLYWQPCLLCSIILEQFIINPIFNAKCSIVYDQMPWWIELISYKNMSYRKGFQCMQRNSHYTMTCSPKTTCWGSKDGAVVRVLASHQCLLGSTQSQMWVEFVVGSLLCSERFFFWVTPVFPSPQKPTFPNSNSILECTGIFWRSSCELLGAPWVN